VKTSKINGFGQNPLRIFDTTSVFKEGVCMNALKVFATNLKKYRKELGLS